LPEDFNKQYNGVWDNPSSGKNQGKLRINHPQLTLAQDDGQKRKFCVPRFVADYQAVKWRIESIHRLDVAAHGRMLWLS